ATAEFGVISYESAAPDVQDGARERAPMGMILNENLLLEIVRPGTGDPLADGEVGEVVVTSLNPDYPMIRLATGDLSAVLKGRSPCGRSNMRIAGWMGRADQTTKVKGMFVHPAQVAEIGKRHDAEGRMRATRGRARRRRRRHPAIADQAARCGRVRRARQPAQRRQGDRRRAPDRLIQDARPYRATIRPSTLVRTVPRLRM